MAILYFVVCFFSIVSSVYSSLHGGGDTQFVLSNAAVVSMGVYFSYLFFVFQREFFLMVDGGFLLFVVLRGKYVPSMLISVFLLYICGTYGTHMSWASVAFSVFNFFVLADPFGLVGNLFHNIVREQKERIFMDIGMSYPPKSKNMACAIFVVVFMSVCGPLLWSLLRLLNH